MTRYDVKCTRSIISQPVRFLSENYFDGGEFLKITETEVKAMVPPIRLAKKVMRLLPQHEVTLYSLIVLGFLCLCTLTVKQKGLMYSVLS